MATNAVSENTLNTRYSGILVHPTSFPSPYGIGDLGPGAKDFIDFLHKAGQKLWQVLPLGHTGFGNSPYQSYSSFAGQIILISPDLLVEEELLTKDDLNPIPEWESPYKAEYDNVIAYKDELFRIAFRNFKKASNKKMQSEYESWLNSNSWADDYALFMALKKAHKGVAWQEWDEEYLHPTDALKASWNTTYKEEADYYRFLQFIFFRQWFALKEYANNLGISIIGDIPIFVASDSCDAWANQHLFQLEKDGYPTCVAGVPPDYFSATGQLWGNPLYDWKAHKAQDYEWWIQRVKHQLTLCDYLRIDHFRGFAAYWSVPYGEETAVNGKWVKGPGKNLFRAIENALGEDLPIIAEDLGIITPDVEKLRDDFHFPGMKVLQFAFDSPQENAFLPHYYPYNCVCYSGTHDNDTTKGWYETIRDDSREKLLHYTRTNGDDMGWDFIRLAWGSVAKMAIVPLQDVMCMGSDARMNVPGTAKGNWEWRYTKELLKEDYAHGLHELTRVYGRL